MPEFQGVLRSERAYHQAHIAINKLEVWTRPSVRDSHQKTNIHNQPH